MDEHDRIDHSLTNHPPASEDVVLSFEAVRSAAKVLGYRIVENCPPSRERSLAITHLEETVMWAIKSIAIHQEGS